MANSMIWSEQMVVKRSVGWLLPADGLTKVKDCSPLWKLDRKDNLAFPRIGKADMKLQAGKVIRLPEDRIEAKVKMLQIETEIKARNKSFRPVH